MNCEVSLKEIKRAASAILTAHHSITEHVYLLRFLNIKPPNPSNKSVVGSGIV
jgi:hypothetical protein